MKDYVFDFRLFFSNADSNSSGSLDIEDSSDYEEGSRMSEQNEGTIMQNIERFLSLPQAEQTSERIKNIFNTFEQYIKAESQEKKNALSNELKRADSESLTNFLEKCVKKYRHFEKDTKKKFMNFLSQVMFFNDNRHRIMNGLYENTDIKKHPVVMNDICNTFDIISDMPNIYGNSKGGSTAGNDMIFGKLSADIDRRLNNQLRVKKKIKKTNTHIPSRKTAISAKRARTKARNNYSLPKQKITGILPKKNLGLD